MSRVAFVGHRQQPDLYEDDRLPFPFLHRRGIEPSIVMWDDAETDWPSFDAVVVRETWDYHLRVAEFGAWIDARGADGTNVWNPPHVLRWNMNKRYLRDLEAEGIPVVPTVWLEHGSGGALERVLDERGWDRVVMKPGVSAAAHRTYVVTRGDVHAHQGEADAMLAGGDVLVQPFLRTLVDEGEWSFVFLGGVFSHAVIKRPASGDFRVQLRHGGTAEPVEPDESLIELARAALDAVPGDLLYGRVDGVRDGGALLIVELEVLEPFLFLETDVAAPERFAAAIADRVG